MFGSLVCKKKKKKAKIHSFLLGQMFNILTQEDPVGKSLMDGPVSSLVPEGVVDLPFGSRR